MNDFEKKDRGQGEELDNRNNVLGKKEKIYKIYEENIAKLIADVEVYAHDLPRQISGCIETVFRMMGTAANSKEDENVLMYDLVLRYEDFIINLLRMQLIDLYKKEIKEYRRTLKQFKYHDITLENGTVFLDEVDKNLKNVSSLLSIGKKRFKYLYRISELKLCALLGKLNKFRVVERKFSYGVMVNVKSEGMIQELQEAYDSLKNTVDLCEKYYPEVINNGYNSTKIRCFLNGLPTIIAGIMALISAIIIYKRMVG